MEVKVYDYLQEDAMNIRRNVFMSEQGYKTSLMKLMIGLYILLYITMKSLLPHAEFIEKIIHISLEELR